MTFDLGSQAFDKNTLFERTTLVLENLSQIVIEGHEILNFVLLDVAALRIICIIFYTIAFVNARHGWVGNMFLFDVEFTLLTFKYHLEDRLEHTV